MSTTLSRRIAKAEGIAAKLESISRRRSIVLLGAPLTSAPESAWEKHRQELAAAEQDSDLVIVLTPMSPTRQDLIPAPI